MTGLVQNSGGYINKYQKYEAVYIKLTWVFLLAGMVYFMLSEVLFAPSPVFEDRHRFWALLTRFIFIAAMALFNLLKACLCKRKYLEKESVFYLNQLIWLFLISFAIIFMELGYWTHMLLLFTVLIISLTKGAKSGLVLVAASFVMHSALTVCSLLLSNNNLAAIMQEILYVVFMYIVLSLFAVFCGMIYTDSLEKQIENKSLMEQLEEKYLQLEAAQHEIQKQYDEMKETNNKLEETNKRLTESVAEFYTLQQISQAIGSILDVKELLVYLNDIILGVMGVNYSTVILLDEKTSRLRVHTTNIPNVSDAAVLVDNINGGILMDSLNSGRHILENRVSPEVYPFTAGRDINSLICIPMNTKSRKFGLVMVEHKYSDAFNEDKVRLLGIIAQQVGIAMENAELYRNMQELASRDGLTGIYNRQYFQERLDTEFKAAQEENYPLSLAIFDIDHFKRFNDTFGHLFGDKVLKCIVDAVSVSLRKNDLIARFGGEEFIMLFPRTSLSEAYEKVELLRKMISQHVIKDNLVTASVTVSFGVSSFMECSLTENDLVRTADDALYEAKAAGRNCVKVARRLIE